MKYLLLDNIRSLLNVGAIFRTADGAGFDRIILTGFTPTPPRREISKTALGAEHMVDWEYYSDPVAIVDTLRAEGFTIYAIEQDARSIRYDTVRDHLHDRICLIAGNEIGGVSRALLDRADYIVEIPMLGAKQSLNVATSVGICAYAFVKVGG